MYRWASCRLRSESASSAAGGRRPHCISRRSEGSPRPRGGRPGGRRRGSRPRGCRGARRARASTPPPPRSRRTATSALVARLHAAAAPRAAAARRAGGRKARVRGEAALPRRRRGGGAGGGRLRAPGPGCPPWASTCAGTARSWPRAQALAQGRIGRLLHIRTHWTAAARPPGWRASAEEGGAVLWEMGVHHLDLWRHLTGEEPRRIAATGDDQALVLSATTEGGTLLATTVAAGTSDGNEVELVGERGRLEADAVPRRRASLGARRRGRRRGGRAPARRGPGGARPAPAGASGARRRRLPAELRIPMGGPCARGTWRRALRRRASRTAVSAVALALAGRARAPCGR